MLISNSDCLIDISITCNLDLASSSHDRAIHTKNKEESGTNNISDKRADLHSVLSHLHCPQPDAALALPLRLLPARPDGLTLDSLPQPADQRLGEGLLHLPPLQAALVEPGQPDRCRQRRRATAALPQLHGQLVHGVGDGHACALDGALHAIGGDPVRYASEVSHRILKTRFRF